MLLSFYLNCFAKETSGEVNVVRVELGEDYLITKKFNKIWIEDQNSIRLQIKNNKYFIKTLKTGISYYRLDNALTKVVVSPIGSKKSYSDWKILSAKFVGLRVGPCGANTCLYGALYRLSDYVRILDYIEKNNSRIYLALKVAPAISKNLQEYIEERLRLKGLTPLKVQFAEPWKIYYSGLKYKTENENELRSLGLRLEYIQQSTDIADNIKVAVKVVEITKNFERKLGVRWPDAYQAQVIGNSQISGADAFDIAINAAEKAGEARILASPNLICRSGKEADFFAGGEFPIKVLGLRSKEILWKRYGIGLKLKPFIDPIGQMSLQIETEVSTLDRSITVDDIPALHTNRVSSYFDLIRSHTIAISGLIKSEVSENSEGIPFLKNIPVLGALFSSKNFQENKSELVIFVTPELMN